MNDPVSTQPPPPKPLIHRRSNHTISNSQSDFELISIKPISYISLKDLLPSTAVNSPRPMMTHQAQSPGPDISIRNRLVKHAAWAYLQPMSPSPDSTGRSFLHRLFDHHIVRALTRAFVWLLRAIRIRSSR